MTAESQTGKQAAKRRRRRGSPRRRILRRSRAGAMERAGVVSRDELDALQADPPEWLRELRRNGPHPRQVVADRLGVSISGLARAEITEPLTTAQIAVLKEEQPGWGPVGVGNPLRGLATT